jgi:hypothetical protein
MGKKKETHMSINANFRKVLVSFETKKKGVGRGYLFDVACYH